MGLVSAMCSSGQKFLQPLEADIDGVVISSVSYQGREIAIQFSCGVRVDEVMGKG